jgi:hypothetical protein
MSHKPMVRSEKPIKTRTLDRMHRRRRTPCRSPSPSLPASIAGLDKGLKKY